MKDILNRFTRLKRKDKLRSSCREFKERMKIRLIDCISKKLLKGDRMKLCFPRKMMTACIFYLAKWENKNN